MRQLVSDQSRLIHEALVTLRATENIFPGVTALVLLHVALSLEALAAIGTHEGHLLRVDLHVAQQTALVEEALPALCACVRPFFLMDALVRCEGRSVCEALATVAGVYFFLLVSLQVPVEVAGTAEPQVTARAFVRRLVLLGVLSVGLQMPHQCRLPGKSSSTLRTQVLAVFHVGALVLSLGRQGLEELPTDQAFIHPTRLVCLLVPLQRLFERETPPTLRTQEGLLTRVDPLVGF